MLTSFQHRIGPYYPKVSGFGTTHNTARSDTILSTGVLRYLRYWGFQMLAACTAGIFKFHFLYWASKLIQ